MPVCPIARRRFLGLSAAAGVGVMLAACGAGAAPTPTPPAEAKPTESAKPAAAAPAKAAAGSVLQYWTFFNTDHLRWPERPTMFAEFEQKANAKVEMNFVQDAQLDAKVQTGFAAKQLPDLIDPGLTQFSVGWGRQGIVTELNDVLAKLGKDDFFKPLVNALTYKGKLYGIPWQSNPQMMFYRKDWAAEKGLKITNWDEWLAFAKSFTGKNPAGKDGYGTAGFMAPVHQSQWVQDWLGPNGGLTFDERWTVVLDTHQPSLEAMDWMKRLSPYFQPGAANNSYGDTNNLFNDQVLAINLSSTTFVNGLVKNKPELVDKVGIQTIPQGPSGKGDRGAYLGCYSFVLCTTSQAKDLAKEFLSWLYDPAVYIRVFKTIDFGHIPVRASVATDPKLAQLVPPLVSEDIKAGMKANEIATLTGEDFGPNPLARQISAQNIWTSMAQKVIADQPAAALKWAADEVRKIVKDSPGDLG
ncbi:MAG TPA: extracellular solute-binding protein [Chloroflexota bacterium]|nr:extracellular solute-binding protein [Chloroflexota bacterium]